MAQQTIGAAIKQRGNHNGAESFPASPQAKPLRAVGLRLGAYF